MHSEAYIALGSNLGDRELNLLRAVAEIGRLTNCKVTGLSSFYETSPVGKTDQPLFYNAALRLYTAFTPRRLLEQLLQIEADVFGRTRMVHWGPRRIDLDLLLHGTEILTEEDLIVPHPRMAERRFVLQPLCEIAPDLVHPLLGKTITELLDGLRSDESVTRI
ncbi:MAG: 2-amino-4-hydroxy-6-hydroxymethyldihydropteridine diphosphokinase [Desulfuromonadales bacterium]|nr:2-amino-4-hydroxy-6-hydroxymethyldihydropteridine diphosphokinase [Desulfuromonadales bacterium]